ncbi:MAG: oxidoreductase [Vulcanimicrobiaceae bacterium]
MFEYALRRGNIGTLELQNRIIMGSMHLGIETRPDDGEALAAFYVDRARGGAALIVTGGSAISRAGAGGRNYSFINDPADASKLARVADRVHAANGRIALQLFHAGRYAFFDSFGLQPVAPSAVPSKFSRAEPAELTRTQVLETIADFARAAMRARDLGYDAVEVMASEGYLINQFLSPITNRRDDDWGGDARRRMRFGLDVLRAIRQSTGPAYPIVFRISGADLMDGSSSQDEVLAFAQRLVENGVDALNVGIGWHESAVPTVQSLVPPGVWVRYAAAIKAVAGDVPVIASNRINTLEMADRVLAAGAVDFISMARPFLADPSIVVKARHGQAHLVNTCIACNQACIDRSLADEPVSCMVNPRAGHELEVNEERDGGERPQHFAVIGAGPAGLEAARALAALGNRVDVFEAQSEIGGQFRMARRIPGKRDFGETIRYFENELVRLGVTVHLDRAIAPGDERELHRFNGVILATGVIPQRVTIPGADLPNVISYVDALSGDRVQGERIAIIGGGGIGVDVAHLLSHGNANVPEDVRFLYEQGLSRPADDVFVVGRKHVALLRRGQSIGNRIGKSTRWAVLKALRLQGVDTYTNISYQRIVPEGVWIVDRGGAPRLIEADTVVIATGQQRNDALRPMLEAAGIPYRVVGGASDAEELNAVRAFDDGLRTAHAFARDIRERGYGLELR